MHSPLHAMRWPSSPLPRPTVPYAGAAAVSVLVAIGATGWRLLQAEHLAQTQSAVTRMQHELLSAQAAAEVPPPTSDFAERLPTTVSTDPIVSQFQRSGAELGVAFVSVTASTREPTDQTLGRTHLSVTLRGSYPNLQTVLAEAFDRHPELVLEHLTLRRLTAPADVEARVDLLIVTRPGSAATPAPGSGR